MADPPVHQALFYEYSDDVLERRKPYREDHLMHAREAIAHGHLLYGGALGDPPHGALFVFRCGRPEVEAWVNGDPYVGAQIVTAWRIEPWTVSVSA